MPLLMIGLAVVIAVGSWLTVSAVLARLHHW